MSAGRVLRGILRGQVDATMVADELQRVGVFLVGLAVVLVLVVFLDAFLTPRVAAALLE